MWCIGDWPECEVMAACLRIPPLRCNLPDSVTMIALVVSVAWVIVVVRVTLESPDAAAVVCIFSLSLVRLHRRTMRTFRTLMGTP